MEMDKCKCCGVRSSGNKKSNEDFQELAEIVAECGGERQLAILIDMLSSKVVTGVTCGEDNKILAYGDDELWKVGLIKDATDRLYAKLTCRLRGK